MNILKEYTLDYVLKNKRSSLAIMVAILIASTLLSTLCIFAYNMWNDGITQVIARNGNWHGELFDRTPGEKLKYVTAHPNVEKVMIKGDWYLALTGNGERPYLLLRDADKEYWQEMPEKSSILEGRIPTVKSEIAVSKQFLEDYPDIKLGSTLCLPVGVRMSGAEKLEPSAVRRKSETFSTIRTENFTIVGVMDITTSSVTPGYYAMGYLDRKTIKPEDDLTVYINFYNPRKIADDLPQIAQSIGYKPDEYGKYLVKYHEALLNKYFIYTTEVSSLPSHIIFLGVSVLLLVILIIGVFVLIIHNAFVLSANSRLKQLGILKSIGATPKQIRHSVTFEALLMTIIPTPLGIILSYFMCRFLFYKINTIPTYNNNSVPVQFTIGWVIVIPAVIFTLVTVWLSAYIPARRIAKIVPVDAINQVGGTKLNKARRTILSNKIFGFTGEIAAHSISTNRKAFRTSFISLVLSFILFVTFLNVISILEAYYTTFGNGMEYDIEMFFNDGKQIEREVKDQIKHIQGLDLCTFPNNITGTTWLQTDQQSAEVKKIGGFRGLAESNKYSIIGNNGKYRLSTRLISLDNESFAEYCRSIGTNPNEYYDKNHPRAIFVNATRDNVNRTTRKKIYIPVTNSKAGDIVKISEKVDYSSKGDYEFDLQIGFVTNNYPMIREYTDSYTLTYVTPASIYESIVQHFDAERIPRCFHTSVAINTQVTDTLKVEEQLESICKRWYGSADYIKISNREENARIARAIDFLKLLAYLISGLLALIGISNAFSSVTENLLHRKREFAMLRSVGMPMKSLKLMFLLESTFFGIKPILLGIPISMIFIYILLNITDIYWYEFFPRMYVLEIVLFASVILLFVGLAYALGALRIKEATLVDAFKDEVI